MKQVQCPHCGKSIVPREHTIARWKPLTRGMIVQGTVGLVLLLVGIIVLITYGLLSNSLKGTNTALAYTLMGLGFVFVLSGLSSLTLILIQYLQGAKIKEVWHDRECPQCKSHWPVELDPSVKEYFSDAEHIQRNFRSLVEGTAPLSSKRLLVIYGQEGMGKSKLLERLCLICLEKEIPFALSTGVTDKSLLKVLSHWGNVLAAQGMKLPAFNQILAESRADKTPEEVKSVLQATGQAAAQVVAQASIPIPGAGLIGSEAIKAVTTSMNRANFTGSQEPLSPSDLTEKLLESFCRDIKETMPFRQQIHPPRKMVLFLDSFEKLGPFDQWICSLAQQLPDDVLLVIAGGKPPDWNQWPEYKALTIFEELKDIPDEVIRDIATRYARKLGKELTDSQISAIVQLAPRLPLVVTMLVERIILQKKYTLTSSVVAEVLTSLVSDMSRQIQSLFRVASTVRYFNKEILDALTKPPPDDDDYDELISYTSFVQLHKRGYTLQSYIRGILDEYLQQQDPALHRQIHQQASDYFKSQFNSAGEKEAEDIALEWLYHTVCANKDEGVKLFRKMAEELACYQVLDQLRTLLVDVNSYLSAEGDDQLYLWHKYYSARLMELKGESGEKVEEKYKEIADDPRAENILRTYAVCDLAWRARLEDPQHMDELLDLIQSNLTPNLIELTEQDAKLGLYHLALGELYKLQGKWQESLACLEQAEKLYGQIKHTYWRVFSYNRKKCYYLERGMWREAKEIQQRAAREASMLKGRESLQQRSLLRAELFGGEAIYWAWAGLYNKTEADLKEALATAEQFGRVQQQAYFLRDLGAVLGLQGETQEAERYFQRGLALGTLLDPLYEATMLGFQGVVALKWEGSVKARPYLEAGLSQLKQQNRKWDEPAFNNWFGMLYEASGDLDAAQQSYEECLSPRLNQLNTLYWQAGALTGLVRIHYAKGDGADIGSLLEKVENLAQQHEYNDYLASLRLTQGHMAWDGRLVHPWGQGYEAAFSLYQQALMYALRYNRFLLEEVLAGRPGCTPLQPLIIHCQKRGSEGRRMLSDLREWWQRGNNEIGKPRESSISPIREGVSLLDGERRARRREEPGDPARKQVFVTDLLDREISGNYELTYAGQQSHGTI